MNARKFYPSDVSNEEWEFVASYLSLLPLDVGQRGHNLCEVFKTCADWCAAARPRGCYEPWLSMAAALLSMRQANATK